MTEKGLVTGITYARNFEVLRAWLTIKFCFINTFYNVCLGMADCSHVNSCSKAAKVFSCVMCVIGLQQCKERRVLYSKKSCHIVSTAIDLLSECVECGGDMMNIECLLKSW